MSRAAVAQRDRDFADMLEAIDALRGRQAREVRRVIVAKFASTCPVCDRPIASGDLVAWRSGARALHRGCFAGVIERGPR